MGALNLNLCQSLGVINLVQPGFSIRRFFLVGGDLGQHQIGLGQARVFFVLLQVDIAQQSLLCLGIFAQLDLQSAQYQPSFGEIGVALVELFQLDRCIRQALGIHQHPRIGQAHMRRRFSGEYALQYRFGFVHAQGKQFQQ